jgi:hypothetical protein
MFDTMALRLLVAAATFTATLANEPLVQNLTGLRPSWGDLETWNRPGSDNRTTEVGLGLHLSGSGGTMLLSFAATLNSRTPKAPPSELNITVGAPFNSNPNTVRSGVLGFVVEIEDLIKKTSEKKTIDLSSRLTLDNPAPGAVPENGTARMSIAQFTDLAKARTAVARVIGVDVSFRPDQLKAVQAFAERIGVRITK